jgi:hypothetical protein
MRVKGYEWVVTYDLIANQSVKILTKDGYEAHVNQCLFSSLWGKGQIIYTRTNMASSMQNLGKTRFRMNFYNSANYSTNYTILYYSSHKCLGGVEWSGVEWSQQTNK